MPTNNIPIKGPGILPSVTYIQGSLDEEIEAGITPLTGKVTGKTYSTDGSEVYDQYRVQGIATLRGEATYAKLICLIAGSEKSLRSKDSSMVISYWDANNNYVSSALNKGALLQNLDPVRVPGDDDLILPSICTILDDNSITSLDEHYYILYIGTNPLVPVGCTVMIDFTILVPENDTIVFIN